MRRLIHRLTTHLRRRHPRTGTNCDLLGEPPVQAVISRIGTLALDPPPPPRPEPPPPAWAGDAAYLTIARQALKALGSPRGGRNRVAATMTRALYQALDPAAELTRLRDEARTVLRQLDTLRIEQQRQAGLADDETLFAPLRAITARRSG